MTTHKIKDFVAVIQTAVHKLDEFNKSQERSTVTKIIAWLKRDPDKLQHRKEVLWAIRQLQIHSRTLAELQNGNPNEQEIAVQAIETITRFNAFIDKTRSKPFNAQIANFLLEQNSRLNLGELAKIHLPQPISVEVYYSEKDKGFSLEDKKFSSKVLCLSTDKISFLSRHMAPVSPLHKENIPHLSKQALELFKMKVIALMEKHALLSNQEARRTMRSAIIQTKIELETLLCYVSCKVNPYPGQTIRVTATFEFDPQTSIYSFLQSKSVEFSFSSTQTAFPHSMQYTGWTQPDLIPIYPYCLEKTPLFNSFYQNKQTISQQLLTNESLLVQAKQVLLFKRDVFDNHKKELLDLHMQLSFSIVAAASHHEPTEETRELIKGFYARVKSLNNAFDYLSNTHQLILENFALIPCQKLQQACTKHQSMETHEDLFLEELNKSKKDFHSLERSSLSDLDLITIQFICALGEILAPSWKKMIFQQFSEILGFSPSPFTLFDLKNLTAMLIQAESFMLELTSSQLLDSEMMQQRLKDSITKDIALYQAHSFEEVQHLYPSAQYTLELKNYFQNQSK
jgi:hypothetical protein